MRWAFRIIDNTGTIHSLRCARLQPAFTHLSCVPAPNQEQVIRLSSCGTLCSCILKKSYGCRPLVVNEVAQSRVQKKMWGSSSHHLAASHAASTALLNLVDLYRYYFFLKKKKKSKIGFRLFPPHKYGGESFISRRMKVFGNRRPFDLEFC